MKKTKPDQGKKCPAPKNHVLSQVAKYLLNSTDKEDEVWGIRVKSIYLTEAKAPRKMNNWEGIFAQMKREHYLVPTGEPNCFYVFMDKEAGTAFFQKLKQRQKKSAAA